MGVLLGQAARFRGAKVDLIHGSLQISPGLLEGINSIEARRGVTTGISAKDRALTIKALVDDKTKSNDFSKPGHIFPLIGKEGGVLRRTGHTEAAIDFARLAGMKPAGVIVEIMNEDGSMARLPELYKVSKKFGLKIVSIEDLVAYRMEHDSLIITVSYTHLTLPTKA